ncbi:MAG TPA: BTAD domain-containing putative transcriptional regulator [Streptosporangiaceae bacterium]|nr:BTAD domain-containing putative transcriptional regulator [Streptosporangiaceae bacterium]
MVTGIRLAVLGPVQAWRDAVELDLGSPQQRGVLALLALHAGESLSMGQIIEALWGSEVPPGAGGTVRTYVYRLRRILRPAGSDQAVLASSRTGYLLAGEAVSTDLSVFSEQVRQARASRAAGNLAAAAKGLSDALLLWHGTALTGVHGHYVSDQRTLLDELRLAALEDRYGIDLDLGRHFEAVTGLTAAVMAQPLRERTRELLMLALYRSGRTADALATYQNLRLLLRRELGMDPGSGLQRLHQRILEADPGLLQPDASRQPRPAPRRPPAQLPPDPPDFVGRRAQIAEMTDALAREGRPPVVALTGTSGIGKTALALHVGHRLRALFPDGQVYASLWAASGRRADPFDVLGGFLRALDADLTTLPDTLGERAALWRTLLTGRRVLIVLDDVQDCGQIHDLLPGAPGSATIITHGRPMVDLAGVSWFRLGPLTPGEAVELLAAIAGPERVHAEPGPSARLAALCSCHPLAIRAAAARLLSRPSWPIEKIEGQFARDLAQPSVVHEDVELIGAAFRRAADRLAPEIASAFRFAAVPDYTRVSVASTAALLDVPQADARAALESLADAHLLDALSSGDYRYDGLVKALARRQALAEYGADACQAALHRLIRFYSATARNAAMVIHDRSSVPPPRPLAPAGGLSFTSPAAARRWLAEQRSDVLALLSQAGSVPESAWLTALLRTAKPTHAMLS